MFLQTSAILDHTQHTSSTVFLVSNTNKRKTSYALWFKLHLSGNTYIICTVLPTHYTLPTLHTYHLMRAIVRSVIKCVENELIRNQ